MPKITPQEGKMNWRFYCPGCKRTHAISTTGAGPTWTFNGDVEKPTFNPSLMVRMGPKVDPETGLRLEGEPDQLCHSFIRDGMIQFLEDCTHELAGQTVEMLEPGGVRGYE